MHELEELQDLIGRAGSYAMLNFSGDTADPPRGALLQKVQEGGHADRDEAAVLRARVGRARRRAGRASCSPPTGSSSRRHHLRTARRYRPHLLSEPEEKILAEKSLTGRSAWTRLFEEQASAIKVDLGERAGRSALEVALSRLFAPDREVRRDAAERGHRGAGAGPAHARVTCSTR